MTAIRRIVLVPLATIGLLLGFWLDALPAAHAAGGYKIANMCWATDHAVYEHNIYGGTDLVSCSTYWLWYYNEISLMSPSRPVEFCSQYDTSCVEYPQGVWLTLHYNHIVYTV